MILIDRVIPKCENSKNFKLSNTANHKMSGGKMPTEPIKFTFILIRIASQNYGFNIFRQ